MADVHVELNKADLDRLVTALRDKSEIRWEAIVKKNVAQMLNAARQPGGTPVDTGELRQSSGSNGDEVGLSLIHI